MSVERSPLAIACQKLELNYEIADFLSRKRLQAIERLIEICSSVCDHLTTEQNAEVIDIREAFIEEKAQWRDFTGTDELIQRGDQGRTSRGESWFDVTNPSTWGSKASAFPGCLFRTRRPLPKKEVA